ncbi:MAG: DUF2207 domain-containing protein [Caldilineaceae bacterium]|nr:DUF2207 domain-containing protein [Caldilineaceae bacterium]
MTSYRDSRFPRRFVQSLAMILGLWTLLAGAATVHAQAPVTYLDYDVTLDVQNDGAIRVTMLQRIQFDGAFTTAFFEIPRDYVASIEDITVTALTVDATGALVEDGPRTPVEFTVDERADTIWVEWTYPQTAPGDVRAFLLDYTAEGATWVYPDGDFVTWDAVNADRSGVGVESSTVRLTLPPAVDMATVVYNASGPEYSVRVDGQSVIFTAQEPIDDATAFNVAASFPHGVLDAAPQIWQRRLDAETVAVALDNVDVDLTLRADGTLDVVEGYDLAVTDGYLDTGFRELQLLYLDDVRGFSMAQDGAELRPADAACTGCFVITETPRQPGWVTYSDWQQDVVIDDARAGAFTADWQHAQLGPGASTSFELRYTVDGALRVDDAGQAMTWDVLPDYGVPVAQAQVTLHLPPGVSADQVTVEGGDVEQVDAQTVRLRFTPAGDPRPRWQIGVTLPAGATDAVKPAWQLDLEQALLAQQEAAQAAAQRKVATRTGGILAIVLGLAGLVVGWFRWGRQRVKEQMGGYLTEPPSELDAGIVAYLVDDNAATKSLLASLFQLAAMGALEIELEPALRLRRTQTEALAPGAQVTTRAGDRVRVSKHIATLFNAVILPAVPTDAFVPLDHIAPGLHEHAADLFSALAEDTEGYLLGVGSGKSVRSRLPMIGFGVWFVLIATVIVRVMAGGRLDMSVMGPLFMVVFVIVIILNFVGNSRRTRHTDLGAQEAARWRKFRTYLLEIEQYGDHGAAQAILERYFHYAVALGVAEEVLKQAAALDASPPAWMPIPPALPHGGGPVVRPPTGSPGDGPPPGRRAVHSERGGLWRRARAASPARAGRDRRCRPCRPRWAHPWPRPARPWATR